MVPSDHKSASLLLTVDEAAKELKVCKSTMFKLLRSGEVKSLLLGAHARRVPRAELEAYVARKLGEQEVA